MSSSGAVVALDEGGRTHKVQIRNMQFVPDFLVIDEGSYVEWTLLPGAENERHVISFDELPIESDCMKKGSNVFKE